MKRIGAVVLAVFFALAMAQSFGGSYVMQGQKGPVTLKLEQDGDKLRGVLTGGGVSFELQGAVDGKGAYGGVYSEQGELYFEMVLQGGKLQLILAPYDDSGNPDPNRAVQYLMTRQSAAGGGNPLAKPQTPQQAADPFVGTFSGSGLNVAIARSGDGYAGQITANGQTFPLAGSVSGGVLQGFFQSKGQRYRFAAKVSGNTMILQTGGQTYRLQKSGTGGQAAGANPLAAGGGSDNDQVIARGQYAELTLDNALAFIEAIEFSLRQLGRQVNYGEAEKKQLLEALVKSYPKSGKQEQVILARARRIWTNAQANWEQTPVADQRDFITDVLVLAFGQQTARQLISEATGAGGSGGGVSAATMGAWGEVSGDISNTTGCWGSNGCSYDSSTNTYDYSADYYSDDY